jgi:hypothetical protein
VLEHSLLQQVTTLVEQVRGVPLPLALGSTQPPAATLLSQAGMQLPPMPGQLGSQPAVAVPLLQQQLGGWGQPQPALGQPLANWQAAPPPAMPSLPSAEEQAQVQALLQAATAQSGNSQLASFSMG